ncbi:MAG: hypothetical protein Q9188_004490 [Gyalolechia gomerana]
MPSGPRIQTVRAAHKPTIVSSTVRRNSHQFTIIDSTEQPEEEDDDDEEVEAGEGCYYNFYYDDDEIEEEEEEEEALAPFNRNPLEENMLGESPEQFIQCVVRDGMSDRRRIRE